MLDIIQPPNHSAEVMWYSDQSQPFIALLKLQKKQVMVSIRKLCVTYLFLCVRVRESEREREREREGVQVSVCEYVWICFGVPCS